MIKPSLVRHIDATTDGVSKRFASSLRRGFTSRPESPQSFDKTGRGSHIEQAKLSGTHDSTLILRFAFYCAWGTGLAYWMYRDYVDEKKRKQEREQHWQRTSQKLAEAEQEHERYKQERKQRKQRLEILEKSVYGFVPGKEELGSSLLGTVESVSPMIVADKGLKAADGTQGMAMNDENRD